MKAILFDNDGVLADTEGLYYRACRDTLRSHGFDLTPAEYREVSLRRGESTIDFAARGALSAAALRGLKAERDDVYLGLLNREAEPREGIEEVLTALHGKAAMAVVTAAHRVHFDAIHKRTGLARYFDFVLTQEDCPTSKPDSAPYLMALKRGGWRAEDCVVIEDTERGLASAHAANLRCFVVPCGPSVGGCFEGAEAVLPDLAALQSALIELFQGEADKSNKSMPGTD